ncbi:group I truncated hemoglobin [Pseudidiomarina sp. E22-M8]|uniref:group I truncated hemoglobin n=1 Tax=Pseudidiomarina sp. E22-M8 TaxID=3424768 RepID=UPI00403C93A7
MKHVFTLAAALMLLLMSTIGQTRADETLYQELGAKQGISDLMASFVLEIAQDERVIKHFENVDIDRFHHMLSEHLCELTGGPCEYSGADMSEVHTGMAITRTEFNAIVEDLIIAMEKEGIATSTQNRLLAKLAEFHDEIVDK